MHPIENCRVAVVGGAGFLGSHLVDHLIDDRGCAVLVVDNLVAGRREFIHSKAEFVHHDITGSEDYLRRLFAGCEYVFNYAAYPYIPDSFARPVHVCDVNFMGAMKVINAAQEAGAKGILQVSSAEIYGGVVGVESDGGRAPLGNDRKIDEEEFVIPHSSYGASKAAVDYFCQAAWRERRTPVIALRQFNCLGERETHPYVVPEIISQLAQKWHSGNITAVRLGNNSTRDFMYAGDAARCAVSLLENGQFGEVVNLGSETGIKIYDLAKLIGKIMGFADVQVIEDAARKRPWEIWSLCSDNSKIRAAAGDFVVHDLEWALARTVKWYESNSRHWPWDTK